MHLECSQRARRGLSGGRVGTTLGDGVRRWATERREFREVLPAVRGLVHRAIRVFSTLPQSSRLEQDAFLRATLDVARWSDSLGFDGSLIYTDNSLVDPWIVAQRILDETEQLLPLVAVQPVYLHPYWCAKKIASLAYLYRRPLALNLVAGGFVRDLAALDDRLEHDDRYDRLVEYAQIVTALLANDQPVSFDGAYYRVHQLRLQPALEAPMRPSLLLSGSSAAGLAAARVLAATAVQYPQPAGLYEGRVDRPVGERGIRIGIMARETSVAAWEEAWRRFPEDRKGAMTHQLAMRTSDSVWHRQLSALAQESAHREQPYWLHPFEQYRTFCPYLVGDHDQVAQEVAAYVEKGFRTFILDIPEHREDLEHVRIVFERAEALVAWP